LAERCEEPGVRGGIGTRRAPDRTLVDVDHPIDLFQSLDALTRCGIEGGAVDARCRMLEQRVHYERRFARARYAGHAGEETERNLDRKIAQIVARGVDDADFVT